MTLRDLYVEPMSFFMPTPLPALAWSRAAGE
jgi:hypothetical protein